MATAFQAVHAERIRHAGLISRLKEDARLIDPPDDEDDEPDLGDPVAQEIVVKLRVFILQGFHAGKGRVDGIPT